LTTEALLKGKAQYRRPPCIGWFRSAIFDIVNVTFFFDKTSYHNEELNRTEPSSLSDSVPCFDYVSRPFGGFEATPVNYNNNKFSSNYRTWQKMTARFFAESSGAVFATLHLSS
jgi:hypothetical protein